MARGIHITIRADCQADAAVAVREFTEAFGKRVVATVPYELSDGTWQVDVLMVKASNDEPLCVAYLEDGTVCRRLATVIDTQRGAMVCADHAPRPRG